jgi:hypothetical protein
MSSEYCNFQFPNGIQCKNKHLIDSNTCFTHSSKASTEFFNKLFKQYDFMKKRYSGLPDDTSTQNEELTRIGITTKGEWKSWIVRNHPDRGGDAVLFIRILNAGRLEFE